MLPHTLLCLLFVATSSAAFIPPPPRPIPRPITPDEPFSPIVPNEPQVPAARPNRPEPEVPETPDAPDNNSQDSNTNMPAGLFVPYPTKTATLSPAEAWQSFLDSTATATSTTGSGSSSTARVSKTAKHSASSTSSVTAPVEGEAAKIEGMGMKLWVGVTGFVSKSMKMMYKVDGLIVGRRLCQQWRLSFRDIKSDEDGDHVCTCCTCLTSRHICCLPGLYEAFYFPASFPRSSAALQHSNKLMRT